MDTKKIEAAVAQIIEAVGEDAVAKVCRRRHVKCTRKSAGWARLLRSIWLFFENH